MSTAMSGKFVQAENDPAFEPSCSTPASAAPEKQICLSQAVSTHYRIHCEHFNTILFSM